ncbi:AMP-binding protein [Virgibacillus xinjiangensis]|uniref:AMP-binding protein n=1 Tax=Virgibacillus xinjiangensis TaxID=393090 RepID=A0ABV7CTL4_9BACI
MNITENYQTHAISCPDKPALIIGKEVISYHEWHMLVQRAAAVFQQENATHHRVAIFLPNGLEFLQVFAGASAAGWASIVCDIRWKEREIRDRLRQSEPDLVIAAASMEHLFTDQKFLAVEELQKWMKGTYSKLTEGNPSFYIGFTSGSTGEPKTFVRSHASWVETFRCNQVDLGMTRENHVLIPGSFVNSTFLYGAISTLYLGGTVHLLKKFSPSQMIQSIQAEPITHVYVVPTMLQALVDAGYKGKEDCTFISTGAKWLPSLKQEMRRRFPYASFYEFYGSSELSYITYLKDEEQAEHGDSVGRPFHNVEVTIRREDGEEAEPGEEGVLYARSRMIFDGYMDNEEATAEVFAGEWATVHDIARQDEDGFVYIVGRKNEMILYGGMNIYPQEIEQVLKKIPGVEEAVVFGVKDKYWGEKVAAVYQGNISIRELKAHCLKHLSTYKIPRVWRKMEQLPHTTGGKVSRREARNWLETEITS